MKNKYFHDEDISFNDLFFVCSMIERVARKLKQKNVYVINSIGYDNLYHLISVADVLHCENPDKTVYDWIQEYDLSSGNFRIDEVDPELCTVIPTCNEMGKVYARLITDTALPEEDYVQGMIRVYNDPICNVIDDYNTAAFYQPSYVVARAFKEGGF